MLLLIFVIPEKNTFFVQSHDNKGEPLLGEVEEFAMRSDDEYKQFLKRRQAEGLILISDVIGIVKSKTNENENITFNIVQLSQSMSKHPVMSHR